MSDNKRSEKSSHKRDNVFFLFKGTGGRNHDEDAAGVKQVPDALVAIPVEALESKPDSLLTALVNDSWKQSEAAGSNRENPIITKPLESLLEWTPSLAEMIRDAYAWFHLRKQKKSECEDMEPKENDEKIELPRDGVELKDALVVLEYYGLTPDDPLLHISLEEADYMVRLRAKLLFKEIPNLLKAVQFIQDYLEKDPRRVTLFLFAQSHHDMDYINKHNNGYQTNRFVRVGEGDDCDMNFEWVQSEFLRRCFQSTLEDVGLSASFLTGARAVLADCYHHKRYGESDSSSNPPPDEYSYIEVEPSEDSSYRRGRPVVEELAVIRVQIPEDPSELARKKQRIEPPPAYPFG
jgi:hypothetical protein